MHTVVSVMCSIIFDIYSCEAFILQKCGNGLWSITSEESRIESITTYELLTQYIQTRINL